MQLLLAADSDTALHAADAAGRGTRIYYGPPRAKCDLVRTSMALYLMRIGLVYNLWTICAVFQRSWGAIPSDVEYRQLQR
jgi:hypothetical protein